MARVEPHEAIRVARSAVRSLQRQARHVSQVLAALDEHLDELEQTAPPRVAQGGTANGNTHRNEESAALVRR